MLDSVQDKIIIIVIISIISVCTPAVVFQCKCNTVDDILKSDRDRLIIHLL